MADVFTPILFLSTGAAVDLSLLNPLEPANRPVIGLALFVIAVLGKLPARWAVPRQRFNRVAVGVGMIPRAEVGLIFASIGRSAGVLSAAFGRWGKTDMAGADAPASAPV